ncbi:hypothetical protein [Nesterenkonia pannonica]|uniref:hypothetical protein n=1 Tax=Nesterenkonia pannonica TaxID=1548602 RepID=UPI00216465E3|nr:hypothetical protein [Nesterenkonia pannonica]
MLAGIYALITLPLHAVVLNRAWPSDQSASSAEGADETDQQYARAVMRSPSYVLMTVGMTLGRCRCSRR